MAQHQLFIFPFIDFYSRLLIMECLELVRCNPHRIVGEAVAKNKLYTSIIFLTMSQFDTGGSK